MSRNEKIVKSYEQWLRSSAGAYADRRERELIMSLLSPQPGERLLDSGCKTGHHLSYFKRKGCDVSGIENSQYMLDAARERMGSRADLHRGDLEDLPFSDNEFDIVTLITSLESVHRPARALSEAIRVCRGRVFVGVLNHLSFSAHSLIKAGSLCTDEKPIHSFGPFNLVKMVKSVVGKVPVLWGSVIFFPSFLYPLAEAAEEKIPSARNPFGAFLGISFPATYVLRTIQDPVKAKLNERLRTESRVPGTASREMNND
jgi:ubiquinone/menaquinone biosynthesis C-methylase UbiE